MKTYTIKEIDSLVNSLIGDQVIEEPIIGEDGKLRRNWQLHFINIHRQELRRSWSIIKAQLESEI